MENQQIDTLIAFLQAAGQRERLQILGILAESTASITKLAKRTGLKETAVLKHPGRLLVDYGFMTRNRDIYQKVDLTK